MRLTIDYWVSRSRLVVGKFTLDAVPRLPIFLKIIKKRRLPTTSWSSIKGMGHTIKYVGAERRSWEV